MDKNIIKGVVKDDKTNQGIADLKVKALGRDVYSTKKVGEYITDKKGEFNISISQDYLDENFDDNKPSLFFEIYRGKDLIHSTEKEVTWEYSKPNKQVVIKIAAGNLETTEQSEPKVASTITKTLTTSEPPVISKTPNTKKPSEAPKQDTSIIRDDDRYAIHGVVLLSPTSEIKEVSVKAFADEDLKMSLGKGETDKDGRFVIRLAASDKINNTLSNKLWFEVHKGKSSERTPLLSPWLFGKSPRLPVYEPSEDKKEPGEQIVRRGKLITTSLGFMPSLEVWLVEQTHRHCRKIAETKTDENGSFKLVSHDGLLLDKEHPDLRFLVFINSSKKDNYSVNRNVRTDGTINNSKKIPVIESRDSYISIPEKYLYCQKIINVPVVQELQKHLKQFLDIDKEQLRPEDVDYLAERTALSAKSLDLLRQSVAIAQSPDIDFAVAMVIAAAGPDNTPSDAIRAGVKVGLLKKSVETDSNLHKIEEAIQLMKDEQRLKTEVNFNTLVNVLAHRLPDEKKFRFKVARAWLDSHRDYEKFRASISDIPKLSTMVNKLFFILGVSEYVNQHSPLIQVLDKHFNMAGGLSQPRDLASWDVEKWQLLLKTNGISVPAAFVNEKDKKAAYAFHLSSIFESSFPHVAIRVHIDRYDGDDEGRNALRKVLQQNDELDFSKPVTFLEQKLPNLFKLENGKEARSRLVTLQRTFNVTKNFAAVQRMIAEKLTSALAVSMMDKNQFANKFAIIFGSSVAQATRVHNRAERLVALTKITYSSLSPNMNIPVFKVLKPPLPDEEKHQQALATWRGMFGQEDISFCDCVHCKSIFGPAAYLFDMLLYLDRFAQIPVSWTNIGSANRVTAMTTMNGDLYATARDNKLWKCDLDAENISWTGSGEVPHDVVSLVAFNNIFFAATADNKLWKGEPVQTNPSQIHWIRISTTPDVIAMAVIRDKLFAASSDNKLFIRDANLTSEFRHLPPGGPLEPEWTHIGHAFDIAAMTVLNGKLYAVTTDNKLWMRQPILNDIPWTEIGVANSVVGMTAVDNKLFIADTNNHLLKSNVLTGYEGGSLLNNFHQRRADVISLPLSCDNTNIEVPHIDLVNEILGDLVAISIPVTTDPEDPRTTTGTSEERRAWPEHKPHAKVQKELKDATRPWSLPIDYEQALARQARQCLPVEETTLIGAAWRFKAMKLTETGEPLQPAIALLAQQSLQMIDKEKDLITEPVRPEKIWGEEIANLIVAGHSPSIDLVLRAAEIDFKMLETLLETHFMRKAIDGHKFKIKPKEGCNTDELYLELTPDKAKKTLDRLHRFERLRRKLLWSPEQLDEALILWDSDLDGDALQGIGLLFYLQNRLDLKPETIVAFFLDPDPNPPEPLRKDKHVISPFKRLFVFGTEKVKISVKTGEAEKDAIASDSIAASIAEFSGTGLDEVRYILEQKYANSDGNFITDPRQVLSEKNPQNQPDELRKSMNDWRVAVSAVYRITTLAAALDLSIVDFVALVELSKSSPLLRPTLPKLINEQLTDAVSFIDLATDVSDWPIPPAELLYLTTSHNDAFETYMPDVKQAGTLFLNIYKAVNTAKANLTNDENNTLASLHDVLSQLLGDVSTQESEKYGISRNIIDRIVHDIEWSTVFFPSLDDKVTNDLPVKVFKNLTVPPPDGVQRTAAQNKWDSELPKICKDLLISHSAHIVDGSGPDATSQQFIDAHNELQEQLKRVISDPANFDRITLEDKFKALLQSMHRQVDPDITKKALLDSILPDAIHKLNKVLEVERRLAVERWLKVLRQAAERQSIDKAVIEVFAQAYSIEPAQAELLLTVLLRNPDENNQSLLRAFVAENGAIDHLSSSLIDTVYSNGADFKVTKREPSLQFDWVADPPPDTIDPKNFTATFVTYVNLDTLSSLLLVETTGKVAINLINGADDAQVLVFDAAGDIQRQGWNTGDVGAFLGGLSPDTETVMMKIKYQSSSASTSATVPSPPVLRVLIKNAHDELVALRTGVLTSALIRFDKAARVIRALSLPIVIWQQLAALSPDKSIDLNDLPISTGGRFDIWLKLTALDRIWQRHFSDDDLYALQAIVAHKAVSKKALTTALNLTEPELFDLLQLINIQGAAVLRGDKQATINCGPRLLDAALRLTDLARKTGLPTVALGQWTSASAQEQYQWSLGALKAQRPKEDWLSVLQKIHDPVREKLRDVLVAWLLTNRGQWLGNTAVILPSFKSPEAISDYLLTDVQMSACMASSRVQFAYAAVQRYVDRMRLGFEPGPEPGEQQDRFEREWTWRRFYRLWQANREVFAYPENWLEPDLRPDKSPFFQELEEELLQGPLTSQSAEHALANYLGKLVEVARPEIIGIVHQPDIPDLASPIGFRGPDLQGTHVFARSRTQPHQLYYRRRMPAPDHRWMPWERIDAELPGEHFIPVVAFRQLYLFNAKFGSGTSKPNACIDDSENCSSSNSQITRLLKKAHVEISWIARQHGQWSPIRRSRLIDFDTSGVLNVADECNDWPDFPVDRFPDITIEGVKIESIEIEIIVANDNLNQNSELKGIFKIDGQNQEIILKEAGEPTWDDGEPYRRPRAPYTKNMPLLFSQIEHFYLKFTPRVNERDDCKISDVFLIFSLTDGNSITKKYTDDVPSADTKADNHGEYIYGDHKDIGESNSIYLRPGYYKTNDWELNLGSDPDKIVTIDKFINDYLVVKTSVFDVEDFEPGLPPEEAYVIHAEVPESGPIVFHLTAQPSELIKRSLRRRFLFNGVKNRNDLDISKLVDDNIDPDSMIEVLNEWPDDWVMGYEKCIGLRIQKNHLQDIEFFSDGTVQARAISNPQNPSHNRGEYSGLTPWKQLFLQNIPGSLIKSGSLAVYTSLPYQLVVASEANISSNITPNILDEVSTGSEQRPLSEGRTFFIEKVLAVRTQRTNLTGNRLTDFAPGIVWAWAFRSFWHPQAVGFLRLLQAHGAPRLLSYSAQILQDHELKNEQQNVDFFERDNYAPLRGSVLTSPNKYPNADVDFSIKGAYADYNWELFFHAPLMIAQRLSEVGRFEEAERWFTLLFDPAKGRLANNPLASFRTRPLFGKANQRLEDMVKLLDDQQVRAKFKEQVDRLNRYPYQPHLIARSRLSAYQKTVVMKYLDHLLAWGDHLFRRAYASDNRTDLETASSRYDLVAKILGRRPELLPNRETIKPRSYKQLTKAKNKDALDLWAPLVELESFVAGSTGAEPVANDGEGIPEMLYFCVPPNDKLVKYWDELATRLSKLRFCRDIEGTLRTISLYGRRIDPGLLVRATALGLDIDIVLGYLSAPLPRFRYATMVQRAKEACDRAQSFGQNLLGTIEKREAEALVQLRSRHELTLLRSTKRVRSEQVDEAQESLEALKKSRESAATRLNYYTTRKRRNAQEKKENTAIQEATKNELLAASASASAADRALLPNLPVSAEAGIQLPTPSVGPGIPSPSPRFFRASVGINYDVGGRLFSNIEQQKASGHNYQASHSRSKAGRLGREAQHQRRWEEWQLQKELAKKDIAQIDKQINSAEIRLRIAEIEQENQLQQIDQAVTVDTYLRDKFSNEKLYRWMESRLSRLYYQQYRLAYDLALKAQRALHYELGIEDDSLLPDTWDSARRGMEAAADLLHELEKMQVLYLDSWCREHEKQKHFSLAERRPLEFLELRQTGECVIRISEHEFDEDEPGDYFRRIKQVAVDIPCVRGPATSVNARLTLLRSEVRTKPDMGVGDDYYRTEGPEAATNKSFRDYQGGTEHIVTSTAINDTGLFDAGLASDRLLPFEGAGVISTWQIKLPLETNHFDRASISDVKLHFLYTARDGGDTAADKAMEARNKLLKNQGRAVLIPLMTYYNNEWIKFINPETTQSPNLKLTLDRKYMPFELRSSVKLMATEMYVEVDQADTLLSGEFEPIFESTNQNQHSLTKLYRYSSELSLSFGGVLEISPDMNNVKPKNGWLVLWVKKTN